jgi:hypothetical protein
MQLHNRGFTNRTDEVQITYDRSMQVPYAVRDDIQMAEEQGSAHGIFTFKLLSDSLAKSP